MRVFISWSGTQSKALALQLHDWLKAVVQRSDPWMSERDIEAGQRWNEEISSRLKETHFGIICLTAENLNAPWLLFEAGALAKALDSARVVPVLLGIQKADLTFPLAQFQAVDADREGFWGLVSALNRALEEQQLSPMVLNNIFSGLWPTLEAGLRTLPPASSWSASRVRRSEREVLEDVLDGVRSIQRAIAPGRDGRTETPSDPMKWEDYFIRGVNAANSRGGAATNLAALRAYNEAIALAPADLPDNSRSRLHAYRGAILKRLGRLDEAEHDLILAQKLAVETSEVEDSDYNMACVMAMSGRPERALALVQKLVSRNVRWASILRASGYFRSLATHPEFTALVGRGL